MRFNLDKRLENDSVFVTEFELCQVRLINDSNYPWYLLIPKRNGLCELTDLSTEDYLTLTNESLLLTKAMQNNYSPDKMNIATLGNIVSQLHIHHIARYLIDIAWPNPVWGRAAAKPYTEDEVAEHARNMYAQLKKLSTERKV